VDLKALRYFVATVEKGSITAAAESCFIAQPSISTAINKLEAELNVTLLTRHKKGVEVTPDGAELYSGAKSLLSHAETIKSRFSGRREKRVVTIHVGSSIAFSYLNELIVKLRHFAPNLLFKITESESGADIRLTVERNVADNEEFIPLWRDRYCLLIPNDHLLAHRDKISLTDLDLEPFIERSFCEHNQEFQHFLNLQKIELQIIAEVDNEELALSLVEMGLGLSIVPLHNTEDLNGRFVVWPLSKIEALPDMHRMVGVALSFKKNSDSYYQQLANHLKEASTLI
jgi:DNA-binding transcriptional LysR family regulator